MSASTRRYLTLLGRASQLEIMARHYDPHTDQAYSLIHAACELRRRAARIYPITH